MAERKTLASTSGRPLNDEAGALIMTLPARISPLADRRGAGRRKVRAQADIIAADGEIDITILDLSETGFRAIVDADLAAGAWTRLSLKGITAPEAQLRWRKDNECGFRFAFPLAAEFVAAAFSEAVVQGVATGLEAGANDGDAVDPLDVTMSWADYCERRARIGDVIVPLTPLMTEMLSVLLMRRGEEISGIDLARAIWPDHKVTPGRMATLHVIISRIRTRLPDLVRSPNRGSYVIPLPPKR